MKVEEILHFLYDIYHYLGWKTLLVILILAAIIIMCVAWNASVNQRETMKLKLLTPEEYDSLKQEREDQLEKEREDDLKEKNSTT